VLVVIEAGIGFAFLALVIGYLPILYQSFSRREVSITLLDARAGSPPSAEELLRGSWSDHEELTALLREWERWSAEVLESHLSYPVLSYYRSQHDYLLMPLPAWRVGAAARENWRASPWGQTRGLPSDDSHADH